MIIENLKKLEKLVNSELASKIQKSIGKTKIVAVSKIEGLINFLFT